MTFGKKNQSFFRGCSRGRCSLSTFYIISSGHWNNSAGKLFCYRRTLTIMKFWRFNPFVKGLYLVRILKIDFFDFIFVMDKFKSVHKKFQVDPTNIFGVTGIFVKTPRLWTLNFEKLWTRFSQNHVFKVGVHDISKPALSIGLKCLHNLVEYIL